jgi:flagellar motor switch protein FliG
MTAIAKLPSQGTAGVVATARPVQPGLSGRMKAAIIVRLMLTDGGELPLKSLPEHLQAALTEQMGTMRSVDRATLRAVVEEFIAMIESVGLSFPGGIDGAIRMLDGHISTSAASRLRRLASASVKADPWDRIATMETEKLLPVLEVESVEVGAVMLSKLAVSKSAELLGKLPGDRARRIAYAINQTGNIDPETVRQIGLSLVAQLEQQAVRAFEAEPHERIGAILNFSPAATRENVLDGLRETDDGLATQVRRAIFTFADIPARIEGRDIAKVIRGVDQATLVTGLAGSENEKDKTAAEFILSNMSQRMAASLRDEMSEKGKVAEKDAEAAMSAIIAAIRDLQAEGELVFKVAEAEAG